MSIEIPLQDDYFKIDPEFHLVGDMTLYDHFPGVQMWWRAIQSITRPLMMGWPDDQIAALPPEDLSPTTDPEALLAIMDRYGVDVACLLPESMMDTTGFSSRWVSNGEMARAVERHPDRFLYEPNLSPIKQRGVQNAIWELEYWVKEKGARIFKFYPPEDTYMNDEELWPFYERAEALGIVLDIHTGFSWVPPGKCKYALPVLLDDVARDFPQLKIVAFHMGYPYCDDLNMVAMGHPNVYLCTRCSYRGRWPRRGSSLGSSARRCASSVLSGSSGEPTRPASARRWRAPSSASATSRCPRSCRSATGIRL